MAESSKILTVSYGTFSCTLEGFDDSFGTMKAIAEYFRDLAADDRYFGAEPPTPDAEMLARIAEREIERRVEAKMGDTGIVLRPSALPGAAAAPAPSEDKTSETDPVAPARETAEPVPAPEASQATPPSAAEAPVSPAPSAAAPAAATSHASEATEPPATSPEDPRPAPAAAVAPAARKETARDESEAAAFFAESPDPAPSEPRRSSRAPAPGSVAARLQRIRAVVGTGQAPGLSDAPADEDSEPLKAPAPAASPEATAKNETPATAPAAGTNEDVPAAPETEPRDDAEDVSEAEALSSTMAAPEADAPLTEAPEEKNEPRAVEEPSAEDGIAGSAFPESQTNQDEAAAGSDVADELVEDAWDQDLALEQDAEDFDAEVEPEAEPAREAPSADREPMADHVHVEPEAIAHIPEASEDEEETASLSDLDAAPEDVPEEPAAHEADQPLGGPVRARVVRLRSSDELAEGAYSTRFPPRPNLAELDGADEYEEFNTPVEPESRLSPEEEEELREDLAELEREAGAERRAAPTGASQSDQPEAADTPATATGAEDEQADDAAREEPLRLSPADQAAADQDTNEAAADQTGGTQEAGEEAAPQERRGRSVLTDPDRAGEDAINRLMTETDAHMNEPESNRRREAIAHLKAAVAATEAARRLGEEEPSEAEGENAFRADLDKVVRPRRAARGEPRTERPRSAPLKLVASQRVDLEAPREDERSRTPVRPRRVSAQRPERGAPAPERDERFARFAAEHGAGSLTDLIEAAAAYAVFVEGEADFSRPGLLRRVQGLNPEGMKREDGLRAFGTLLRQGRIVKRGNGRFEIAPDSRYRPQQAAAQG